jgi:2-polyprenyl-3-methyl-5-hydroxy-6-metoxy-1,4-benzoquinol methylase
MWDRVLLESSHEDAVAAWRDSLHGFAKRLAPLDRAKFLMAFDSAIYPFLGEAAIAVEGGIHPKHRILRYHDYFVSRIRPGERVVDLGCGIGALAASIAERAQANVVGVDWSAKNLSKARTLSSARGIQPMPRFIEDDITTCRVEGTFDVVVLSNVLEHLVDRPRLLRTWREWYEPKKFLIRVPAIDRDWRPLYKKDLGVEWRLDDTHETEYTRGQLESELGEAGLSITECQTRFGEYWLSAVPVAQDETTIRVPVDQAARRGYGGQTAPDLSPQAYLKLQIDRSLLLKDHDGGERSRYLIRRMAEFVGVGPDTNAPRILCVGCRNGHELNHLAAAGFVNTTGIDLHSADPRIMVMDMHDLAFPDASFDVVYASHVLEHALEPKKAGRELRRVVRPGGLVVLEVPIRYGRRGADLWDFGSPDGVIELFEPCDALWTETGPQIGATQRCARVILRVPDGAPTTSSPSQR